jgi:hypothetical protein
MNMKQYIENRNAFPEEELKKYYGRHVAWSLDGTRIIASGDDDEQVLEAARAAGYTTDDFVFSYVHNPDEVYIGGLFFPVGEAPK